MQYGTPYKMIIGERSNGKTYSVKERIIQRVKDEDIKFMYIRREHGHITRNKLKKLFEDISDKILDMFGDFITYTSEKSFILYEKQKTVGYASSVEDAFNLKGIPYDDVKIILFDEFLDYDYMQDEIPKFLHLISTIVRDRQDVEIYMLANTVSKYSPYFNLFGIDPTKLRKGEIHYIKHKSGVSCAVEYCKSANITDGIKRTHKYLGFDNNESVNMILYGEWEYTQTNTKYIDDIGWSSDRELIPVYFTALEQVYELSVYTKGLPVLFVRKVNTQQGMVNKKIKYNLSYDNSIRLSHFGGDIVPITHKITSLLPENIVKYFSLVNLCIESSRVVFDNVANGSDFLSAYKKI